MGQVRLFWSGGFNTNNTLAEFLGKKWADTRRLLQDWDEDALLKKPVDDIIEQLVGQGSGQCPRLRVDDAFQLSPTEVDQEYDDFGERRTRRVRRFVLVVPFDGDKQVFLLQPSTFSMAPPQALQLLDRELHLAIDNPPRDAGAIKAGFGGQIAEIEENLERSRQQIELHNQQLRNDVSIRVTKRREEILSVRNLQAEIGYPVLRRPDADTYAVPVRRRTVRPQSQRASTHAPFKPEPALMDADYQAALRVLQHQRNALERTPSLAAKLGEEEIRNILLIGLNAQFEGAAGGELFNGEGKTDILIRGGDRNVFIGECKVWSGPKTIDDALSQLLVYLVWRDVKAAILLFIRNKDVSDVIAKAISKIEGHPNWKRSSPRQGENDLYGFTMFHQGDPEREIHLALIPFALRPTTG